MRFREWLVLSEVRHLLLEDDPIPLHINGGLVKATQIDLHFEDFDQTPFAMKTFVQEVPSFAAGSRGQVFVNAGWDGYWFQIMGPGELHQMQQHQVYANPRNRQVIFDSNTTPLPKPMVKLAVNPLDAFTHIDPNSLKNPDGTPAQFRPPYDKKPKLHWWDFTEVLSEGGQVVKQPCRIRGF